MHVNKNYGQLRQRSIDLKIPNRQLQQRFVVIGGSHSKFHKNSQSFVILQAHQRKQRSGLLFPQQSWRDALLIHALPSFHVVAKYLEHYRPALVQSSSCGRLQASESPSLFFDFIEMQHTRAFVGTRRRRCSLHFLLHCYNAREWQRPPSTSPGIQLQQRRGPRAAHGSPILLVLAQ